MATHTDGRSVSTGTLARPPNGCGGQRRPPHAERYHAFQNDGAACVRCTAESGVGPRAQRQRQRNRTPAQQPDKVTDEWQDHVNGRHLHPCAYRSSNCDCGQDKRDGAHVPRAKCESAAKVSGSHRTRCDQRDDYGSEPDTKPGTAICAWRHVHRPRHLTSCRSPAPCFTRQERHR